MGLLDKMDQLEKESRLPKQDSSEAVTTSPSDTEPKKKLVAADNVKPAVNAPEKGAKKVPQLKMGATKKSGTAPKKAAVNDKLSSMASGLKKPDALANAKKTSKSALHTHLNKTDQHGISHKDRIEQELQAQVKKIKKIMVISVASLIGLIFVAWLIFKIVAWTNSADSSTHTKKISYFQMKTSVTQYAHSKGFDRKKFDRAFERFNKQASSADKAKALKLKERLLKERSL